MRTPQFRFFLSIPLTILLILPGLIACGRNGGGGNAPLDNQAVGTEAALTVQAQAIQLTLQAQSALLTAQAGGQAPPSAPPAAAEAPVILASIDTNCRSGPGKDYDKLGYLGAGQQTIVLGKEPSGNWWLIANPKNPSEMCWVWAETTTVTGDIANLPVVEAGSASQPPAQEPASQAPPVESGNMSAKIKFSSIVVCNGASYAIFNVVNTSSMWIKSVDTVLQETGSHRALGETKANRPFLQAPQGCPPGISDLKAGNEGYFAAKFTQSVNVNNSVDATITLCSEPNHLGKCSSTLVQFNIPVLMPAPPEPENLAAQVNFSNIHSCDVESRAFFEIVNNGTVDISSVDIQLEAKDPPEALSHTFGNKFFLPSKSSCPPGQTPLKAGNNGFVGATMGSQNLLVGQKVEATIKLCSGKDLAGQCITYVVNFTIK